MQMKRIYCDNAASTPLDKDILKKMNDISERTIGNPSSIHKFGQESKAILERARLSVCNSLGCNRSELIFTSCGTESNNIALLGILKPGDHFITSTYEHPAILKVANILGKKGIEVSYVRPHHNGKISTIDIEKEIKPHTKLISIMFVNNEIGTINPINEISEISHNEDIIFHTDAVQCVGKKRINLRETKIDLLSLSAHKFYGPKGVGALFIRDGVDLRPTYIGGSQENNLSPGTENIIGIYGLSLALEMSLDLMEQRNKLTTKNESLFINSLKELNLNFNINGEDRLPGILNLTFMDILSTDLVMALDIDGYAISGGSACSSGITAAPNTLIEIGLNEDLAKKTVRISFGKDITENNIINLAKSISIIIRNTNE